MADSWDGGRPPKFQVFEKNFLYKVWKEFKSSFTRDLYDLLKQQQEQQKSW